jgi:hypothetical protein
MNIVSPNQNIEISGYGSPFSHDVSACTGEIPRSFSWVFDRPSNSGIEVYLDFGIHLATQSKNKYKYLWLSESKSIAANNYQFVKDNISSLRNVFRKIFVHDDELLQLNNSFQYVPPASNYPWVKDRRLHDKKKLASMISSGKSFTEGHRFRNGYMQKQMQSNPWIDFFGHNFNHFEVKEDALSEYMFSITIENTAYSNYYTEKIMDCFATGTIPIYYGTPKIGQMFNSDGVIALNDDFDPNSLNRDLYYSKLDAIKENLELCLIHKKADDELFDRIIADMGQ